MVVECLSDPLCIVIDGPGVVIINTGLFVRGLGVSGWALGLLFMLRTPLKSVSHIRQFHVSGSAC